MGKIAEVAAVSSLATVDDALKEIVQRKVEMETGNRKNRDKLADARRKVMELEAEERAFAEPHERRIAELNQQIETWCNANRDQVLDGESQSRDLIFGRVGWRKTPGKLVIDCGDVMTLDIIKAKSKSIRDKFLEVKTTVKKASLRKLSAAELSEFGARIEAGENFICEPKDVTGN
jgi:phage host-nuclease inhibitor protein Gam